MPKIFLTNRHGKQLCGVTVLIACFLALPMILNCNGGGCGGGCGGPINLCGGSPYTNNPATSATSRVSLKTSGAQGRKVTGEFVWTWTPDQTVINSTVPAGVRKATYSVTQKVEDSDNVHPSLEGDSWVCTMPEQKSVPLAIGTSDNFPHKSSK